MSRYSIAALVLGAMHDRFGGYADDHDQRGHEHHTLLLWLPDSRTQGQFILSEIAPGSDRLSHRGSMIS
jgi:hypothetical protein